MRPARLALLSIFLTICVLFAVPSARGQISETGIDQFGTYSRNHIQTINLYNLNNHIEIPLFAKNERGVNFDARLIWDLGDSLPLTQSFNTPPTCCYFLPTGFQLSVPTAVHYTSHGLGSQTCVVNTSAVTTYFDSIVD
jgi:hypothetical protein